MIGSVCSLAEDPQGCIECHSRNSQTQFEAWKSSAHAAKGVGCADCHGTDHSTIFARKGRVSAGVCGKCHPKQKTEFDQSLHAKAVDFLQSDQRFKRLPDSVAELGCLMCHQIGAHHEDGSKGNCNSCHSGHSFSLDEARRPEACAFCHTGPDHPHMAMWQASKHGQLYASTETRAQSPTCVTCHMPKGTHNTSTGLSLGQVSNGAVIEGHTPPPVKMRIISPDEAREQRSKMVSTCLPCHSSRFAAESLEKADRVKKEADALLREAVELIGALHGEGLLVRPNGDAEPNTESQPGHALALGGDQRYDGLSQVEQRFFEMYKFHHASTFKGAYHHSPEYTHNQGYLRMRQDLTFMQTEALRLRAKPSPGKNSGTNKSSTP